jgi:tetratricopeptide (TPR) repeat protein
MREYGPYGRVEEAVADRTAAIRWHPHLPEAYYNRADLLQSRGDTDAALADLTVSSRRTPATSTR